MSNSPAPQLNLGQRLANGFLGWIGALSIIWGAFFVCIGIIFLFEAGPALNTVAFGIVMAWVGVALRYYTRPKTTE